MTSPEAQESPPVPPTGAQFEISRGDLRATVTEVGAGLRTLTVAGRPLVAGFEADEVPPAGMGQLLSPWPNRVADGRYTVAGQIRQLDLTEPARGHAIHGLTRWLTWHPVERAEDRLTLATRLHHHPGYPHVLDVSVTYELADNGLTTSVAARNVGATPAPYGVGAHPYLLAGQGLVDGWSVKVPARRWLRVDDRMIPAELEPVEGTRFDLRGGQVLGEMRLDTAFTGLSRDSDGFARVSVTAGDGGGAVLELGPGLDWVQLYTGEGLPDGRRRTALAVEPMSCPPNAFGSGTDVCWLDQGGSVRHQWRIVAL